MISVRLKRYDSSAADRPRGAEQVERGSRVAAGVFRVFSGTACGSSWTSQMPNVGNHSPGRSDGVDA